MKRSWTTYSLVVGLGVLLAVLAVLQYRWLTEINQSAAEKARVRVREQTDRFALDFNREIQQAYFNFQADAATWETRDWTDFNERYEFWKKNAAYPDLIAKISYLGKDGKAYLEYDPAARVFTEVPESREAVALRERLADDGNFRPVDPASMTLYLPIHRAPKKLDMILRRTDVRPPSGGLPVLTEKIRMPPKVGHLIIRLDPEVVRGGLFDDLAAKYFGDGDYLVGILDENGAPVLRKLAGEPDAQARLFDLAPSTLISYGNRDLIKSIRSRQEGDTVNSRVESQRFDWIEGRESANTAVKVEITEESKPRTSVFTMTTRTDNGWNPWTLVVQHSAGSLDGHMAATLRRNLAVGFGILMLLAAAVAAVIISALRAKAFAQRQLDFVSSVSHEFRTPLAVIYSAGENLADGVAKERTQVAKYGNLIKGEGRKLSGMVEQILEFAGAKSGKRKFSFANAAVDSIIADTLKEMRPLIEDKGFQVETSLDKSLPNINADISALSQALQNLVANSIKYSNGSSWIRLSASNGGGRVKIAVEDRGMGIAKGDLKRVFEPFFRSKNVVDAQIHGNGLGLSLVKQIVDAHGGTIRAESESGKGSKFTIELNAASLTT